MKKETRNFDPTVIGRGGALASVRAEIAFDYREVDIDSDPALYEQHKHDIPVIEIDGRRAFKHRVAPRELRERLLR